MKGKDGAGDVLRKRLEDSRGGGVRFLPGHEDVISGRVSLEATTNRSCGREVYLAGRPAERPAEELLRTGREIGPGTTEVIGAFELKCFRRGGKINVRLFKGGKAASLALEYSPPDGGDGPFDEGLFTYLGPIEDLCTPWSDNDPSQCQVVAVDDLRRLAREKSGRSSSGRRSS